MASSPPVRATKPQVAQAKMARAPVAQARPSAPIMDRPMGPGGNSPVRPMVAQRPQNVLTKPGNGPLGGKPAPSFNPQNVSTLQPSFGDSDQFASLPAFRGPGSGNPMDGGRPGPSFNPENVLTRPGTGPMDGKPAPSFNPQNVFTPQPLGNPGFGNPMQSAGPGASFPGMQENFDANRLKEMYAALQGQGQGPGPQPFTQQPQPFGQQPQPFGQQPEQQQQYDQFMQQFMQQPQPQPQQNPYTSQIQSQLQGFQNQAPVQPPMQAQQAFNDFRAGAFQQPQQAPGMGQQPQAQQPFGQPQQPQAPQAQPAFGQPQQAPAMGGQQPQAPGAPAKPAGGGGGGVL